MPMPKHRKMWTISGDGDLAEVRLLGVWFFSRTTHQNWSPLMHEVEAERGVRIGSWRLSLSRTVKVFHDGKEPAVVPATY